MKKLTKKETDTFIELARRMFETERMIQSVTFYRSPVDDNAINIRREYISSTELVSKVQVSSRKEKRR